MHSLVQFLIAAGELSGFFALLPVIAVTENKLGEWERRRRFRRIGDPDGDGWRVHRTYERGS